MGKFNVCLDSFGGQVNYLAIGIKLAGETYIHSIIGVSFLA